MDKFLNFTHRDLYLENIKFGLIKFAFASSAFLRKKQPFEVVFYFVVKGVGGLELRSALQLRGKAKTKELPFYIHLSLFLGWRKGFLLTKRRLPLRRAMHSQLPKADPPPRLLAAASAATQKPPPTPLHVRGGDIALLTQSVANLNLHFQDAGLGNPNLQI